MIQNYFVIRFVFQLLTIEINSWLSKATKLIISPKLHFTLCYPPTRRGTKQDASSGRPCAGNCHPPASPVKMSKSLSSAPSYLNLCQDRRVLKLGDNKWPPARNGDIITATCLQERNKDTICYTTVALTKRLHMLRRFKLKSKISFGLIWRTWNVLVFVIL